MTEEFESVELELSEDDILYYLEDEDGREVGFVIDENGVETEYFYEEYSSEEFELVDDSLIEHDGETIELEIADEDILYYLYDEDGNEIGFVVEEDGIEVECYYAEDDDDAEGHAPYIPEKAEDHGRLHKLASIAGFEGNKARKAAGEQLDKVRGVAEVKVDQAKSAATEAASKAKATASENDLGITRESVKETTADLNAIAKEGAETAKELKEAYDDIMENFGFLVPKKVRRKLP